jgi:hypothetical protein
MIPTKGSQMIYDKTTQVRGTNTNTPNTQNDAKTYWLMMFSSSFVMFWSFSGITFALKLSTLHDHSTVQPDRGVSLTIMETNTKQAMLIVRL